MQLSTYVSHFRGGTTTSQEIQNLAGRIIRGKKPEDFLTLTDDPDRKIVMLVGPDGLAGFLGKKGHEMITNVENALKEARELCEKLPDKPLTEAQFLKIFAPLCYKADERADPQTEELIKTFMIPLLVKLDLAPKFDPLEIIASMAQATAELAKENLQPSHPTKGPRGENVH